MAQTQLLAVLDSETQASAAVAIELASTVNPVPELPSQFRWIPGWLGPGEAGRLFELLLGETPWEDHAVTLAGRRILVPRRVAYYGPFPYAYSGIVHPARPLPQAIETLRERLQDVASQPFNTVLMNLYRSGSDSVSWHSDDDYPHGGHPTVASLSLGEARRFRIAHKHRSGERYSLDLTAGGLLIMGETSQRDYRHALPKSAHARGPRINLTFRYMAASNLEARSAVRPNAADPSGAGRGS